MNKQDRGTNDASVALSLKSPSPRGIGDLQNCRRVMTSAWTVEKLVSHGQGDLPKVASKEGDWLSSCAYSSVEPMSKLKKSCN
jgi:hypothetical protein